MRRDPRFTRDAISIRPEREEDRDAVYDLTSRAFAPMPYSEGDEPDLINRLRAAGALSISLLAARMSDLAGHIAFSPAFAEDRSEGWYALGPVSVDPSLQRQGIGTRLIEAGLERLREWDAAGCILVGDPRYYQRFGFCPRPNLAPEGEPRKYYMMLSMRLAEPASIVAFHPVFHS